MDSIYLPFSISELTGFALEVAPLFQIPSVFFSLIQCIPTIASLHSIPPSVSQASLPSTYPSCNYLPISPDPLLLHPEISTEHNIKRSNKTRHKTLYQGCTRQPWIWNRIPRAEKGMRNIHTYSFLSSPKIPSWTTLAAMWRPNTDPCKLRDCWFSLCEYP